MLEKLSMYDGLTNIRNRRFFDETLKNISWNKPESSLALMMIDIDFFKPYNDNYGHGQGEMRLKKSLKLLKKL